MTKAAEKSWNFLIYKFNPVDTIKIIRSKSTKFERIGEVKSELNFHGVVTIMRGSTVIIVNEFF